MVLLMSDYAFDLSVNPRFLHRRIVCWSSGETSGQASDLVTLVGRSRTRTPVLGGDKQSWFGSLEATDPEMVLNVVEYVPHFATI